MPTGLQDKLAHCRGVRRMHLNSNMSACEQAPVSQFGSSAHGSLLRANFSLAKLYTKLKLHMLKMISEILTSPESYRFW